MASIIKKHTKRNHCYDFNIICNEIYLQNNLTQKAQHFKQKGLYFWSVVHLTSRDAVFISVHESFSVKK